MPTLPEIAKKINPNFQKKTKLSPGFTKDPKREFDEITLSQIVTQSKQRKLEKDIAQFEKRYSKKQLNTAEFVQAQQKRKSLEKRQKNISKEFRKINKDIESYNDKIQTSRISQNQKRDSERITPSTKKQDFTPSRVLTEYDWKETPRTRMYEHSRKAKEELKKGNA